MMLGLDPILYIWSLHPWTPLDPMLLIQPHTMVAITLPLDTATKEVTESRCHENAGFSPVVTTARRVLIFLTLNFIIH